MKKTKVLHYIRHMGLGGTEKTCQLLASHTNPNEFECAVAYDEHGHHPRRDEFEKTGIELYPVDKSIKPLIHNFKPDIIHVYRSGFPEFPTPGKDFDPRGIAFVETNVFGQLDDSPYITKTLFMSDWLMKDTLRRQPGVPYGHPRFDFVNNPVEEPYTSKTYEVADRWHDEGAIILGRCGRPDNGIYHALNTRSAFLLRQEGHDVRFMIVAPPSNMLQDLADWDVPFHVIEPTIEPLALSMFYNSVDIYAHARADGETFGVNIAEAMIHGLPVVTHVAEPSMMGMSVFQSQTELVDHNTTGLVVPNDLGEYRDAVRQLVEDPALRRQMGNAGLVKAMREYRVDVCVNKLEGIYRELVS